VAARYDRAKAGGCNGDGGRTTAGGCGGDRGGTTRPDHAGDDDSVAVGRDGAQAAGSGQRMQVVGEWIREGRRKINGERK
jgi:hypothetical protein